MISSILPRILGTSRTSTAAHRLPDGSKLLNARQVISYLVVAIFVLFFFSSGIKAGQSVFSLGDHGFPDFSLYKHVTTLSAEEFPLDDSNRRVIIVGDVHGSIGPFESLLHKLSYDPSSDVLVHAGDIIAKGTHKGSMAVLSYMTENNVTGVRGNHDQKVIEWRGWLEWIDHRRDGKLWLDGVHSKWIKAKDKGAELDDFLSKEMKRNKSKWWKKIPDGWILFGDHYTLALDMSTREYDYLLSLPLVLHIPSAHTYIVHAGLLPSDPRYKPQHPRQPLAHVPPMPSVQKQKSKPNDTLPVLRRLQETALLTDIPQNKDPWVVLNMRGVNDHNEVIRTKDGTPWSQIWNRDMDLCDGFEESLHLLPRSPLKSKKPSLPCRPSTVIYGHAASRGLDIKRWSYGLDSGCVYEGKLTSLVLGPSVRRLDEEGVDEEDEDTVDVEKKKKYKIFPYGDDDKGRIVHVKCH